MRKIFVIRHGQDTDNVRGILNGRRDTDLTDLGRQQAILAGKKLKKLSGSEKIDVVYVSPLKRCRQTAELITQTASLPQPQVMNQLIERDFGFFTGRPAREIRTLTDDYLITDQVDYFLSGEGVEIFPEAYQRAVSVWEDLKKIEGRNILLVTHGDFGKMLRASYYDWGWRRGLLMPYLANTEIMVLEKTIWRSLINFLNYIKGLYLAKLSVNIKDK